MSIPLYAADGKVVVLYGFCVTAPTRPGAFTPVEVPETRLVNVTYANGTIDGALMLMVDAPAVTTIGSVPVISLLTVLDAPSPEMTSFPAGP